MRGRINQFEEVQLRVAWITMQAVVFLQRCGLSSTGVRCVLQNLDIRRRKAISNALNPRSSLVSSTIPSRMCSQSQDIWDDSDWMNHGDSNAEAYENLDITKLRPFPEFRNVVTGPVWPDDAFNLVWKKYFDEQTPLQYVEKHDNEWKEFVESKGFDPSQYFSSDEYKERYGNRLIWTDFKRNHKGSRQKQRTRIACLFNGKMCGNPCPLCRDDNILLNFRNLTLLNHFIDPHNGMVHHSLRTGVCRNKQKLLEHTIWLARDQGFLPTPVRKYESIDMSNYHVDHLAVRPIAE